MNSNKITADEFKKKKVLLIEQGLKLDEQIEEFYKQDDECNK